ncbi:MAG: GNAT family N-acetyltransferase [Paracoccaceae bacterium]
MTTTQPIASERLNLRGLLVSDIPFVQKLIGDPRVRQFLGGVVVAERREALVNSYYKTSEGEAVWVVELKEHHRPVGMVFLSNHKDGADIELSYQFDPDWWGKGYAFEAAGEVLRFATMNLRFNTVIAETQSANLASCRLLERLGMSERRRIHRFGAEQIIYST